MAEQKATNITWHEGLLSREQRWRQLGHAGATVWLTGLPSSGKSTVASALEQALVGQTAAALARRYAVRVDWWAFGTTGERSAGLAGRQVPADRLRITVHDLLYDEQAERFLPDRLVEGTCYICGYQDARGDQCENCGKLLNAIDLVHPRSKNDGSTPEFRETTA